MTKIVKSDAEWRAALSPEVYEVARGHGTERPGSHPGFPKGPGKFLCACCGAPLFDAATKYESGSGWPSFYAPLDEGAVEEKQDDSLFMRRTEVLCARCDAHLGHVFPDGPPPTGLRYCMNGVAMKFAAEKA
ncbi:peptide-methionine (R)-S-oxide reductase MsrB [Pikeienuella piscinae]|uniref:peptide-methionine (R)-S-oxide reductase n=1 Tax=Pikeienuella piscinae TaxID=2748098 RepID=A0A7L5BYR5_9RHOB|nr:peptide-methionine (R)-S-oxide reductase MsrB [Pikeienuella piscinae]QIE55978.1 peptide-methionine (R)-S-oxide reductase MsrB [Pikeienuella piscinae]